MLRGERLRPAERHRICTTRAEDTDADEAKGIGRSGSPGGAFDKATKIGWKVDKKRTKWTWSHPKVGGPSGIVKAMVLVKKGVLTAAVKGTAGDFTATAPVAVTLTLPGSGDCGETRFDAPGRGCAVKSKGKSLVFKLRGPPGPAMSARNRYDRPHADPP